MEGPETALYWHRSHWLRYVTRLEEVEVEFDLEHDYSSGVEAEG